MNNEIYVGGQIIDEWGTFKRNKRDIIKEFENDGKRYKLVKNFNGYYNKALMYENIDNNKNLILVSYNTIVAEINGGEFIVYGYYSQTTAKHINEFLDYFLIKGMSKKEMEQNANKWLKVVENMKYSL